MSQPRSKSLGKQFGTLLGLLFGSLILLIGFLLMRMGKKPMTEAEKDQAILKILKANGCSNANANIWVAVSKHETDSYRSNLCVNFNNYYGMGVAEKRPYTRSGTVTTDNGETFSAYKSLEQCVTDLVFWINYTKFPKDEYFTERFVEQMQKRGYFTDSMENYLNGIQRFL